MIRKLKSRLSSLQPWARLLRFQWSLWIEQVKEFLAALSPAAIVWLNKKFRELAEWDYAIDHGLSYHGRSLPEDYLVGFREGFDYEKPQGERLRYVEDYPWEREDVVAFGRRMRGNRKFWEQVTPTGRTGYTPSRERLSKRAKARYRTVASRYHIAKAKGKGRKRR